MKSYEWKIKTNFHNYKIPKEGSQCICLLVIFIDSVYRTGKSCCRQVFLEEYKHVVGEKKVPEYITDNIEMPMMKILIKEIPMKKIKTHVILSDFKSV